MPERAEFKTSFRNDYPEPPDSAYPIIEASQDEKLLRDLLSTNDPKNWSNDKVTEFLGHAAGHYRPAYRSAITEGEAEKFHTYFGAADAAEKSLNRHQENGHFTPADLKHRNEYVAAMRNTLEEYGTDQEIENFEKLSREAMRDNPAFNERTERIEYLPEVDDPAYTGFPGTYARMVEAAGYEVAYLSSGQEDQTVSHGSYRMLVRDEKGNYGMLEQAYGSCAHCDRLERARETYLESGDQGAAVAQLQEEILDGIRWFENPAMQDWLSGAADGADPPEAGLSRFELEDRELMNFLRESRAAEAEQRRQPAAAPP